MNNIDIKATERQRIRDESLDGYSVRNGCIRTPGKFEMSPVWAPYYWDQAMNGMETEIEYDGDGDDATPISVFTLDEDDWKLWPELRGVAEIKLWENDQGFVMTAISDTIIPLR